MELSKRAYRLVKAYLHREWERIQDTDEIKAYQELETPLGKPFLELPQTPPLSKEDPKQLARQILGVSEAASYEELRSTFERLYTRSTPSNFSEGSEEQKIAEEIHQKVKWAYNQLSKEFNPTIKRFRFLEIESE